MSSIGFVERKVDITNLVQDTSELLGLWNAALYQHSILSGGQKTPAFLTTQELIDSYKSLLSGDTITLVANNKYIINNQLAVCSNERIVNGLQRCSISCDTITLHLNYYQDFFNVAIEYFLL